MCVCASKRVLVRACPRECVCVRERECVCECVHGCVCVFERYYLECVQSETIRYRGRDLNLRPLDLQTNTLPPEVNTPPCGYTHVCESMCRVCMCICTSVST